MSETLPSNSAYIIEPQDLQALIGSLRAKEYQVIGSTVRDSAIIYDELASAADLPVGWTDSQDAGYYRLARKGECYFDYTVGPDTWKKFLHPPEICLWRASRADNFIPRAENQSAPRYALFGVRACELAAIQVQDRIFLDGAFQDAVYRARRESAFIVAVNCTRANGTCFCASMGTGPRASNGFDLALTEVREGDRHSFLVEIGSERGAQILDAVPHREATPEEAAAAERAISRAASQMGRALDTTALRELLYRSYDDPMWEEVAERCLTCGNCTFACPTCFCVTVEDSTALGGETAERWRKWDSCFSLEFSYIVGGSVRRSASARYRQWMVHKLAAWHDQYGVSGCVGCGRCITWCPVGIDITHQARVLRESEQAVHERHAHAALPPRGG